jgi:3'-5' exoribonuclease
LGHIILGIERVEDKIRQIPDFPKDLSMLVKHLLLSHHGQYNWGSPKRPMTLEAVMLHYLDDMDAKINGIQRFIKKQLPEGSRSMRFAVWENVFTRGGFGLSSNHTQ